MVIEKILQKRREHYEKNKTKLLQQMKEYYYKNKETILQDKKEYHKKNKSKNNKKCIGCGKLINKISKRCKSCSKLGEKNPIWKGNNVGIKVLHEWIRRHKPKVEFCERCNKKKKLELANISGLYKRDINDYEWLCRKCHMEDDKRMNNLKQFRTKNGE